ncbi:MAG: putative sugar nucleotidyl transferase, partial [Vicingaceae bacterium]
MNIILFDQNKKNLLPFSYTRPIADFRCGILTLKEKWSKRIPEAHFSYLTDDYLKVKYGANYQSDNFYISGNLMADDELVQAIQSLQSEEVLWDDSHGILAIRTGEALELLDIEKIDYTKKKFESEVNKIANVWDVFVLNARALEQDFDLLTKGRESQALDQTNTHIGNRLFIEEGAKVQAAILNSTTASIYVGKIAEFMEGYVVRGG